MRSPSTTEIVFKALGDGFACAFQDPADALSAVVAAQHVLQKMPWPSQVGALRVRMAIHTGRASLRDGDYFGPTLNRTARLMSLASGEQVLVSSASAALLLDSLGDEISLRELGSYRLKDLALPEITFQVIAPGSAQRLSAHRGRRYASEQSAVPNLELCRP